MTAITSKTFQYEPALGLPLGARPLGELFKAAGRLLAGLFTGPAKSVARNQADEAEEVRALARTWEKTDPGFAADLYAAAARHEGLPE